MPNLLSDLSTYLVAQGIVRVPRTAGAAPPLWLEPRKGTPAPGEGQNTTERGTDAVLAAFLTGGVPARPFESSLREDIVDIWVRTTTAPRAFEIETQLRTALADKRHWTMGARTVIDSEQWRPLQRLTSDDQAFTYVAAYWFQLYA